MYLTYWAFFMQKSKDLQVKLRKLFKTQGKTQKVGTLGFQGAGKASKQRRFCGQIFMARPRIVL